MVSLLAIDIHLPGRAGRGVTTASTWPGPPAFTVLVLAQLFNAFNARSETTTAFRRTHNPWLWGAVLLAFVLQVAVVHLPFLNAAFGTEPLGGTSGWCAALASVVLWVEEVRKLVLRAAERRRAV